MTERPILFSGPMVRAILAGTKTQTRRVVKGAPSWATDAGVSYFTPEGMQSFRGRHPEHGPVEKFIRCPYGGPGDRLWVRETWQEFFSDELPANRRDGRPGRMGIPARPDRKSVVAYRADGELAHPRDGQANWRPSIHMPRWASRMTLEVTEVRVQRLQEIGEEDAKAEGIVATLNPRASFAILWDSINGKGKRIEPHPWESNPWVWAVSFKRADEQ